MMPTLIEEQAPSGKRASLLALPPLRTVLVPLKTHGSSTSRTTRLLLLFLFRVPSDYAFVCQQVSVVMLLTVLHSTLGLRMDLLMTEQVNQCKVAIGTFPPVGLGQKMVNLNVFIIEEGLSTFWTSALLSFCQFLLGEGQVFGFGRLSLHRVVPEFWVVWRCFSFDKHMPLYREPSEFEQVTACLFVTKHPSVLSI